MSLKCPQCQQQLTKPARQGGVLVRNAYIRLLDERLIVACPNCKTELEKQPNRLIVLVGSPSAISSSRSSAPGQPKS